MLILHFSTRNDVMLIAESFSLDSQGQRGLLCSPSFSQMSFPANCSGTHAPQRTAKQWSSAHLSQHVPFAPSQYNDFKLGSCSLRTRCRHCNQSSTFQHQPRVVSPFRSLVFLPLYDLTEPMQHMHMETQPEMQATDSVSLLWQHHYFLVTEIARVDQQLHTAYKYLASSLSKSGSKSPTRKETKQTYYLGDRIKTFERAHYNLAQNLALTQNQLQLLQSVALRSNASAGYYSSPKSAFYPSSPSKYRPAYQVPNVPIIPPRSNSRITRRSAVPTDSGSFEPHIYAQPVNLGIGAADPQHQFSHGYLQPLPLHAEAREPCIVSSIGSAKHSIAFGEEEKGRTTLNPEATAFVVPDVETLSETASETQILVSRRRSC